MYDIKNYKKLTLENSCTQENESVCLYGAPDRPFGKFAVVIPTYKRLSSLKVALDSVLCQTIKDIEIIIVDNNDDFSDDRVLQLVQSTKDSRIIYYKNKMNIGGESNFNRGILLAKAEYFVLLHDDDSLKPDCLQVAERFIKDKRAIYNKYDIVYQDGCKQTTPSKRSVIKRIYDVPFKILHRLNPIKNIVTIQDLFEGLSPIGVIGVVYHRESFLEIGGFDRQFYPGTDFAMNINYIDRFGGYYTKQPLANYSIGQNDSLGIGKTFAVFNYNMRAAMLGNYVRCNKRNRYVQNALYHYELKDVTRVFGIVSEKLDRPIDEISDRKIKNFFRWRAMKGKIKYGD